MTDAPINFTLASRIGGYDPRPIPAMNQPSPQLGKNPYMKKGSDSYQTYGLPVGKTTLGPYRMGDITQIASAIYPGEYTPPNPRYSTPIQRTYENVAFNVSQPSDRSEATNALVLKFGETKFKAERQDPFALYIQEQKLQQELNDISRTAGGQELEISREILRNMALNRRIQNEADYARRLESDGISPDEIQKQIDNIRMDNAKYNMKSDDRTYQAKLLLTRLASSRGALSTVAEPLVYHKSIIAPQATNKMMSAMGQENDGFGQSVVDLQKQFLTPDFYRRHLRRSNLTQESADRETALNTALLQSQDPINASLVTGFEREQQIEHHAVQAMSRIEALRQHGMSSLGRLPPADFAPEILATLFHGKEEGDEVRFVNTLISDMNLTEAIVALNQLLLDKPQNVDKLAHLIRNKLSHKLKPSNEESITKSDLIPILHALTPENYNVRIPAVIKSNFLPKIVKNAFQRYVTSPDLEKMKEDAKTYVSEARIEEVKPVATHESLLGHDTS